MAICVFTQYECQRDVEHDADLDGRCSHCGVEDNSHPDAD